MNEKRSSEAKETVVLSISGMTCGGCANTLARILSRVPGVTDAKVDLASGCATVWGKARSEPLIAAAVAAGYGAQLSHGEPGPELN